MENSLYLSIARQTTLMRNMEIVSNNIANMNTSGFRAQNTVFEEYLSEPEGGGDPLSFVMDRGQYQITTEGPVGKTDNPLDISLSGPGFIGVQAQGGETAYTRAGNFRLDQDGQLMMENGFPVMSAGGAPINIPTDSTEIKIDAQGVISNQDGQLAQIMVVEFDDDQQLKPMGNNMYSATIPGIPATETTVAQGFLEGSNVNAVLEMTRMIETMRSIQQLQQNFSSEHERLRSAIQKLTGN